MAYVGISQSLLSDVRAGLHNLRNQELASIGDPVSLASKLVQTDALSTFLHNKLWEGFEDLHDRLKPFTRSLRTEVKLLNVAKRPDGTDVNLTITRELNVPCFRIINVGQSYYGPWCELSLEAATVPGIEAIASAVEQQAECRARWDKVETDVMAFINNAKSLNEAVKLWPDVRRYIPEEYLTRMDKQSERSKPQQSAAADILAKMDLDVITTSTVLARMATPTSNT